MFLNHGCVGSAQLGTRLVEGGSRSKTPEELRHAMDAPGDHGRVEMMRACHHVGDDFRVLWIWNTGLEDAYDRCKPVSYAAEANLSADDGTIFPKRGRPETIGENDHASGVGTVVRRSDESPQNGVKPHHVEEGAADNTAADRARLTEAHHGETDDGEVAKRIQGLHARAQVL